MILSSLPYFERYISLHPQFFQAFAYLRNKDIGEIEDGRYKIDGDKLSSIVVRMDGKSVENAKVETHREHIDIQYIISGKEQMGWKPLSDEAKVSTAYNPEKDVTLYESKNLEWISVEAGQFAIFFPDDVHAPGVSDGPIHKVVLKVKI